MKRGGFTLAPWDSSTFTHSMLPEAQASQSGVLPSIFLASTFRAEKEPNIYRLLRGSTLGFVSINPRTVLSSGRSRFIPPGACLVLLNTPSAQPDAEPNFEGSGLQIRPKNSLADLCLHNKIGGEI